MASQSSKPPDPRLSSKPPDLSSGDARKTAQPKFVLAPACAARASVSQAWPSFPSSSSAPSSQTSAVLELEPPNEASVGSSALGIPPPSAPPPSASPSLSVGVGSPAFPAGSKPSVSFASVVANRPSLHIDPTAPVNPAAGPAPHPGLRPRFPPLNLPNRQVSSKDGKPSISFSASEIAASEKRFEHSIVAKFTVGRPSLLEIQKAFQSNWVLKGRASISDIWDGRHILVILDSEEDVRSVLSSSLNKVGHAFFRMFR